MDIRKRLNQVEKRFLNWTRGDVIFIDNLKDYLLYCHGRFIGKKVVFNEEFMEGLKRIMEEVAERVFMSKMEI